MAWPRPTTMRSWSIRTCLVPSPTMPGTRTCHDVKQSWAETPATCEWRQQNAHDAQRTGGGEQGVVGAQTEPVIAGVDDSLQLGLCAALPIQVEWQLHPKRCAAHAGRQPTSQGARTHRKRGGGGGGRWYIGLWHAQVPQDRSVCGGDECVEAVQAGQGDCWLAQRKSAHFDSWDDGRTCQRAVCV
jgi:hypothetical protein